MDFRPIKNERRVSTHSNYVDDPDNKDTFPPDAVVSILTWRSRTHRSSISISSKIGIIAPCRCANALRMGRAPSGLPQKATPSKPCKVVRSLNPIVPFRPSPFNKSEQIGSAAHPARRAISAWVGRPLRLVRDIEFSRAHKSIDGLIPLLVPAFLASSRLCF